MLEQSLAKRINCMDFISKHSLIDLVLWLTITVGSAVFGFVLSYFVDFTRFFNIFNAHDLGFGNLLLCILIFTFLSQIISLYLFSGSGILILMFIGIIILLDVVVFLKYFY